MPSACSFRIGSIAACWKRSRSAGVRLVALRCAGFNNVDLAAAAEFGIAVVRVPAYSPYAVAEYTVGLMLTLNRKIHRAANRVREGNFSLDGLLGFDFHGRTVGIVGTGQIGAVVARIMHGFGCRLLGRRHSPEPRTARRWAHATARSTNCSPRATSSRCTAR